MGANVPPEETTPVSAGSPPRPSLGELAQVTRAMVAIYKDHLGRGPRHAHSHYAGPDSIVCYLEETLTPVEHTLIRIGRVDEMQTIRQLFQLASEPQFRQAVEEITGRKVTSFMSANDVNNDFASEIFVFERKRAEE